MVPQVYPVHQELLELQAHQVVQVLLVLVGQPV